MEQPNFHLISVGYKDENNNKPAPQARNQTSPLVIGVGVIKRKNVGFCDEIKCQTTFSIYHLFMAGVCTWTRSNGRHLRFKLNNRSWKQKGLSQTLLKWLYLKIISLRIQVFADNSPGRESVRLINYKYFVLVFPFSSFCQFSVESEGWSLGACCMSSVKYMTLDITLFSS